MKSLETNLFLLYGLVEVNRAWHHVHPETAKLRELAINPTCGNTLRCFV